MKAPPFTVLLTRPEEDSERLKKLLKKHHITSWVEPMLTVHYPRPRIKAIAEALKQQPAAILITSANGLRALMKASSRRNGVLYTVGSASAEEARTAGYKQVRVAEGNANLLARLVMQTRTPAEGTLLHIAGSVQVGDLAGKLKAAGYTVSRVTGYDAEPVRTLSPSLVKALKAKQIPCVVFYSPRTARVFCRLVERVNVQDACQSMQAICLSEGVAKMLEPSQWQAIHVATTPDTNAMLALIDRAKQAIEKHG
ncbi:MAG: uroporphyrinogen-III synthase [Hyphomicrobiales bacterium]|nr:uroporphyrinogen-III synthase [Rickettsiales bacterium]MCP5361324.1 uroporphyrinogen-III synthase [Hyphomicrobiales bacterium]